MPELDQGPLRDLTPAQVRTAKTRIMRSQGGRKPSDLSPEQRENIAENLRLRIEASGVSQRTVAEAIGVATPVVSNHMNPGYRSAPSPENLQRYATLFHCQVEDLLGPPPPAVLRTKVAGNLEQLPPERRQALERQIAAFERRWNADVLAALAESDQGRKNSRKK